MDSYFNQYDLEDDRLTRVYDLAQILVTDLPPVDSVYAESPWTVWK